MDIKSDDQVLVTVSTRIKNSIRETDTVPRLGGGEFTIILSNLPDSESTKVTALKILDSLREPIDTDDGVIQLSASLGISTYPEDGRDLNHLVNSADQAIYKAMESGKDGWRTT